VRYPVILTTYGGPASPSVSDSWRLAAGDQGRAYAGLIQMTIDHRGSGHFGKAAEALMHRNLGRWEMHDYIEIVKWLRRQPYVDSTKICITGASYGGYVAALALTYGAGYFTHGIANLSVTDWHLYDSHYTERYMDAPDENPDGYATSSVQAHARNYKGLLRIVHGALDDNVLLQNALQLADTLQSLNKHFELMVYPDQRHGVGGAKFHHYRAEMMRFYYTYLLEKPFPAELFLTFPRTMGSPH
jgi:dipeptidyl-peptidase-4